MSNNNLERTPVVNTPDRNTANSKKNRGNLNAKDEEGDKEESGSTANALIDLAVASCELFHDERGDGYALVHDKSKRRTFKLRSRPFSSWLTGAFYKATKRAPSGEAMRNALAVLEAEALHRSNEREMFNRFAVKDDAIFIDLADKGSCAVKVTAAGWEILDKPPVMFRRYSHQQALPEPLRAGKLSDLHEHLAIKSNDDRYLLEAYLVSCAFSNVPRPAITFHGPQGASKTTTARCIKAITDPSLLVSVDLGKSPADLAQVLDHHGVPCLDNVTCIPQWAADLLCRGITGGAFSKRELYSDDADIILSFMRPIIITGINIPTHAPDLLDRLLLIELERISPRRRLDEATFWSKFNQEKPHLFGALLDAISGTLKHLPNIVLTQMTRMADFNRIACAYAEYAGIGSKKMLAIIIRHTARQTEEVLAADPVATAVFDFTRERELWIGTATELLELLNQSAPKPRPTGWPKLPNQLTREMNILAATLNAAGVTFVKEKRGRKSDRKLTLKYKAKTSSASSVPSQLPVSSTIVADGTPISTPHADGGCEMEKLSSALSSAPRPSICAALGRADDADDEIRVLTKRQKGRES